MKYADVFSSLTHVFVLVKKNMELYKETILLMVVYPLYEIVVIILYFISLLIELDILQVYSNRNSNTFCITFTDTLK